MYCCRDISDIKKNLSFLKKEGVNYYMVVSKDVNRIYQIDDSITAIQKGIKEQKDISFFTPFYEQLSFQTNFIGSFLQNDLFYRGRLATDRLFEHINELKYPPAEYASKGRLNDSGEQIAYMSLGELGPMVELDIGYYQLFCMVKIRHLIKGTCFFYVGIKGEYSSPSPKDVKVNKFYMNLLNRKEKEYYNATIALGRLFLKKPALDVNGGKVRTGMIYNSVQEDKTNKNLYNIAVYPEIFDSSFRIEEANYFMLAYDLKEKSIILHDINKGSVQSDGRIVWEKTYKKMHYEINERFSRDIYKISEDAIVHFKYGGGKIVRATDMYFIISFPNGEEKVLKNNIANSTIARTKSL